jgi:hypothetical protein
MIHRKITKDIKYITGYHTQEFRHSGALDKPIQGKPEEAWLGIGYYFWLEEDFAVYWGVDKKKKRTGYYDIYSAEIEEGEILNASFNEKAYFNFRQMIDDAVAHFQNKSKKVTLLQVHRFLSDNFWSKHGVTGIIFDDLPHNNDAKNRVYSYIEPFYYKKRLQLVVFDKQIIHNFAIHKEEQ